MSDPKFVRKQIKNVIQAMLPELLNEELLSHLKVVIDAKLKEIYTKNTEVLKAIDERSKALQHYTLRQKQNIKPKE